MEPKRDFDQIVTAVASDIRSGKCETIDYLYEVLESIDNLPMTEKERHQNHIDSIKRTITSFNTKTDRLTRQERDTLVFPFEWRINERINHAIRNNDVKLPNKTAVTNYYPSKNNLFSDIISKATMKLLINLSGNMLSSNITNLILEYLDSIKEVEKSSEYLSFEKDLMVMLGKEGWSNSGGFAKEPNKNDLIRELNILFDKYVL